MEWEYIRMHSSNDFTLYTAVGSHCTLPWVHTGGPLTSAVMRLVRTLSGNFATLVQHISWADS